MEEDRPGVTDLGCPRGRTCRIAGSSWQRPVTQPRGQGSFRMQENGWPKRGRSLASLCHNVGVVQVEGAVGPLKGHGFSLRAPGSHQNSSSRGDVVRQLTFPSQERETDLAAWCQQLDRALRMPLGVDFPSLVSYPFVPALVCELLPSPVPLCKPINAKK